MKTRTLLILIIAGMLFIGCGSSEDVTETESNLPSWYTNPPSSDDEYMYAIGEGTSSRRSMAREQSMQDGRSALSTKLETEVSAMQKNFEEETTSGEDSNYRQVFTDVSKSVTQQTLRGVEVDRSHFTRTEDDAQYDVILLVRMPIGEAANAMNEALQNTLSRDEELYTKFKSSKAFEDMKNSIEDMEEGNMPSGN